MRKKTDGCDKYSFLQPVSLKVIFFCTVGKKFPDKVETISKLSRWIVALTMKLWATFGTQVHPRLQFELHPSLKMVEKIGSSLYCSTCHALLLQESDQTINGVLPLYLHWGCLVFSFQPRQSSKAHRRPCSQLIYFHPTTHPRIDRRNVTILSLLYSLFPRKRFWRSSFSSSTI